MDDRRAEFLRQTEGMIFGDAIDSWDRARKYRLNIRKWGITLSFPPEWRSLRNKPDEVDGDAGPEGDALMSLESVSKVILRDTPARCCPRTLSP